MRWLSFLLLLCVSASAGFAQNGKDEKDIRDLLARQTQAWNQGNIEAFMKGYWESDSLLFIGKSGVTHGYQNTLANYKKGYGDTAKMGKLFFELLEVRKLSGEYYWVVGKWFLKRSVGDIGGHYTLLFRKIKGRWVIVADHSS
jgi:ketosteroid isomerase-like protein